MNGSPISIKSLSTTQNESNNLSTNKESNATSCNNKGNSVDSSDMDSENSHIVRKSPFSSTVERGEGPLSRPFQETPHLSSTEWKYLEKVDFVDFEELAELKSKQMTICAYRVNTFLGTPFVEYVTDDGRFPSITVEEADDETQISNACYAKVMNCLKLSENAGLPSVSSIRSGDASIVKGFYMDEQKRHYVFMDLNSIPAVVQNTMYHIRWATVNELFEKPDENGLDASVKLIFEYVDDMKYLYMEDGKEKYPSPVILYGDPLLVRTVNDRLGYFYYLSEKKEEEKVCYVAIPPSLRNILSIHKGDLASISAETLDKYDERFCDSKAVKYKVDGIWNWCWKDISKIMPHYRGLGVTK